MKVSLIDADSIIHIVSYHNAVPSSMIEMISSEDQETKDKVIQEFYESKDPKPVLDHVDSFIADIIHKTESTHYLGFVGSRAGSDTFRHKLAVTKPYKGQRSKLPHWTKYWKPIIIKHMVEKWKFIEVNNIEADDACAMCATHFLMNNIDYIVCSPDKDLKQIEGNHYDYKKMEFAYVNKIQALQILYKQILVGDSTDNISGCPKVGEKSPFLGQIDELETLQDMHKLVKEVFESKKVPHMFKEQLDLVYMLRMPDGIDLKEIPIPVEYKDLGDTDTEFKQEKEELPPIQENTSFNQ